MVSIRKVTSIIYYDKLYQEDYWSRGNHSGLWGGKGAQALGLSGEVDPQILARLFAGFAPDGQRALTRNAGSPKRCCGWDMTASACKGFSVLWSQADEETRRALERIQEQAVRDVISYLEDNCAFVRTGKGGQHFQRADLVVAFFSHFESRNHDPNLHTHMVVLNVGVQEGKTNSLYSPSLFEHKLASGAIYRQSLAWHLEQDLGIDVERRGDFFEIKGIPEDLLKAFSSRREKIEETLNAQGWTSAKAAAKVTLATRPVKREVAQETLQARWNEVGQSFGFTGAEAMGLLHQIRPTPVQQEMRNAILGSVRAQLSELSLFQDKDIVRAIAVEAPGRSLSLRETAELHKEILRSCEVAGLSNTRHTLYALTAKQNLALSLEQSRVSLEPEDELEIEWETI